MNCETKRSHVIIFTLMLVIIAPLFIRFTLPMAEEWHLQWRAGSFTSTTGVMESCDVLHLGRSEGPNWKLDVQYKYRAGNESFSSRKTQPFDTLFRSRKRSEQLTSQLQPGQTVTVYFDPADPATAVLWKEPHNAVDANMQKVMVVFLPILLTIASWTAIYWLVQTHRHPRSSRRQ